MWNYFIPFATNLLQGQNPLEAGKNAAVSGTVGDIAGNFGSALGPDFGVAQFGSVQNAANVPSLLTNSAGTNVASLGMADTLAGKGIPALQAGYTGPTSMMQNIPGSSQFAQTAAENINPQDLSYMQKYQATQNYSPYTTGSQDVADLGAYDISNQMYPDYKSINTPGAQDVATAGGYEEVPLYKKAYDKVAQYIEDKPLEAGLMAATGVGALYEGFKGPERSPVQAPLGPQLGGKQYSGGGNQLLKIRRPR